MLALPIAMSRSASLPSADPARTHLQVSLRATCRASRSTSRLPRGTTVGGAPADRRLRCSGAFEGLRGHEKQPAPHHHRRASRASARRRSLYRLRTRPPRRAQVHPPPTTLRRAGDAPRRALGRRSRGRGSGAPVRPRSMHHRVHERCTVSAIGLAPARSDGRRHAVAVRDVIVRWSRKKLSGMSRGRSNRCPVGEPVNVCALDPPFRSDLLGRRARRSSMPSAPPWQGASRGDRHCLKERRLCAPRASTSRALVGVVGCAICARVLHEVA